MSAVVYFPEGGGVNFLSVSTNLVSNTPVSVPFPEFHTTALTFGVIPQRYLMCCTCLSTVSCGKFRSTSYLPYFGTQTFSRSNDMVAQALSERRNQLRKKTAILFAGARERTDLAFYRTTYRLNFFPEAGLWFADAMFARHRSVLYVSPTTQWQESSGQNALFAFLHQV